MIIETFRMSNQSAVVAIKGILNALSSLHKNTNTPVEKISGIRIIKPKISRCLS